MKKIIIVTGDPNSINSEIIYKSWSKIKPILKKRIYFVSNTLLLKKQFHKLKYNLKIKKVNGINDFSKNNELKVIDVKLNFTNPFKVKIVNSSKFIMKSLEIAHNFGKNKNVGGVINCAIDKKLLKNNYSGVTELLASMSRVRNNREVMLITNNKFSVSPITTHIKINDVSKNITKRKIINKILTINEWFKKIKKKKPFIGLLGLNPHNGEMRSNSEEKKIILPCIEKLQNNGIKISGPLISDTLFIKDYKKFDIIVGMYHDQVLTPFKTLFNFDAINVTLGLKYLRASPDHGPAKNLVLKKKANPISLIKCINFIDKNSR